MISYPWNLLAVDMPFKYGWHALSNNWLCLKNNCWFYELWITTWMALIVHIGWLFFLSLFTHVLHYKESLWQPLLGTPKTLLNCQRVFLSSFSLAFVDKLLFFSSNYFCPFEKSPFAKVPSKFCPFDYPYLLFLFYAFFF